jgi:hypothetical protein
MKTKKGKTPKRKNARGLNPSQQKFVVEYLKDQNATQAYMRAYGIADPKVAKTCGPRLMANVGVYDAVKAGLERIVSKLEITAEKNLKTIAEIAYADPKVSKGDKLRACELIGKTMGQFTDVVQTKNEHTIVATRDQLDAIKKEVKSSI